MSSWPPTTTILRIDLAPTGNHRCRSHWPPHRCPRDRPRFRRCSRHATRPWSSSSAAPTYGSRCTCSKRSSRTASAASISCWSSTAPSLACASGYSGARVQLQRGHRRSAPAFIVMQLSTGQTLTQRLQPTHSSSITSIVTCTIDGLRDRLVRCVFAYDMTATAFDAEVLVDDGFFNVVEVKVLPVRHAGDGTTHELGRDDDMPLSSRNLPSPSVRSSMILNP